MFFQLDYTRSAVRTALDLQSAETDTFLWGRAALLLVQAACDSFRPVFNPRKTALLLEADPKGGISRLAQMRKPQCTGVHENFRIKRNEESTLLSQPSMAYHLLKYATHTIPTETEGSGLYGVFRKRCEYSALMPISGIGK